MPADQECLNCHEIGPYLGLTNCGYCNLPCCEYCLRMHEDDCDLNPDNEGE